MRLIAGLGNTGKQYENTRHNAGFMAVRWLAQQWQLETNWSVSSKHSAVVIKTIEKDAILAQPTTMMNDSGRSIRALMDYYKIDISEVTLIHDDADLGLGEIKTSDSTQTGAGHHGVLSVIEHAGSGFKRIRVGIGRPEQPVRDISGYVLSKLSKKDRKVLEELFVNQLEQLLDR